MVLTPFLTFQLSSGRHCLTFFVLVFLADFKIQGVCTSKRNIHKGNLYLKL